jgi:glutathione synthase/RimK-type ligase-like ATP-grasp enzyme
VTTLKVLVIATQNSAMTARISMALDDAGFRVATLTPHGNPARRLRKVRDHFSYRLGSRGASTVRVIVQWSPDFLVATDDLAVRDLHALHRRITASKATSQRHIADLIELSLGSAAGFPVARNKSDFVTRAGGEGMRCPKTVIIPADGTFRPPAELSYPVVVKADNSYGGLCVRIADSEAAVRAAVWELQTPSRWHSRLRRLAGAILGSHAFAALNLPLRRTVSLQQYITGRSCNRAVVCWEGKVLAGISVEAVEVTHEHGPASVVRPIDHPEMAKAAEHMVKCLNLSGFVGFDFVLDSSSRAWVIEMNPRVTPICHLSPANGTNLAWSLYRQMGGLAPLPAPASADCDPIALFPGEIIRSPSGAYIQSCHHDVPWNEPELVRGILSQALRMRLTTRLRTFAERRFPQFADVFTKLVFASLMPQGRNATLASSRNGEVEVASFISSAPAGTGRRGQAGSRSRLRAVPVARRRA